MKSQVFAVLIPLALGFSCGPEVPASQTRTDELAGPVAAKKHGSKHAARVVPKAEALFAEVLRLIREHYVDAKISDDALWTGAIEGVLERLIQLPGHKKLRVNSLLSPGELKELKVGIRGRLSGVGAVLKMPAGKFLMVMDVIPGGPAQKAGLRGGDRILGIDGKSISGWSLRQIVDQIRGPEGSTVNLLVQRDANEWTQSIVRRSFKLATVDHKLLSDHVGYLKIRSFNKATVVELDRQLASLRKQGAKRLVLDLRNCVGGLFDASVQTAERFLRKGDRIVSLRRRGGTESVQSAKRDHGYAQLPLVVLVGRDTASGAELVAGALSDHGRATLVGERTAGKGTVEKVLDLRAGWAVKLSVARFYSPKGRTWLGTGILPDVPVPQGSTKLKRYAVRLEVSSDTDAQLRTALSVLKLGSSTRGQ